MIGLFVSIGRQRGKRFEIAKERVTIGSDASNDLVLRDGGVAPFHAALVRIRDRWFLSVREANAGSSSQMRPLEDGARIQVGEYTVVLAAAKPVRLASGTSEEPVRPAPVPDEPTAPRASAVPRASAAPRASAQAQAQAQVTAPMATLSPEQAAELAAAQARVTAPMNVPMPPSPSPFPVPPELPPFMPWLDDPSELSSAPQPEPAREPVERALIDAIVGGDEAGRLVYADWLEGRGDTVRAEFLRLQRALDGMDPKDPAQAELLKERMRRLGELAPQVDFAWRRMIARPAVEGCRQVVTDFKCKMDWGALAPTEKPNVRRCGTCGDNVYYVTNLRAARAHVRAGHCVAVDFKQARRPGDLEDNEEQLLAMRTPRAMPPFFPPSQD